MSEDPLKAPELPAGDWLPMERGHRVWWCEGGAADGLPVLIVHGGPGGASRLEPTRWFDGLPVRWIAIDQRGCGRSTPRAATADNDLAALLHDMERLRMHLGLPTWAIAGGSWGARVALAYAQHFRSRTAGLFVRSPFFGAPDETRRYVAPWRTWLGETGLRWVGEDGAAVVDALYREATELLINGTFALSPDVGARVAQAWGAFDDAQSAAGGVAASGAAFDADKLPKADDALASWRVHSHYALSGWGAAHGFPIGLPQAGVLAELSAQGPISVVWGEADATCDPAAARRLVACLPDAAAREVPGAGHRMGDPRLGPALRDAARDWIGQMRPAT